MTSFSKNRNKMSKITLNIILIFLFSSINLLPGNRIFDWPLKINNGYSSSFQEFRPGHFNGMAQVVNRLGNIVQAHKMYFGQKDFQH